VSLARCLGYAAALLAGAALLLLAFAWPGPGVPWQASERFDLALAQFESPGEVAIREASVRATGADAGGVTLLRQATPGLSAEAWRYLRYRIDEAAPSTKRMLVWNGEAGQDTALLPSAAGTLDLGRHPGWKGTIAWLGVAAAPIDYLPAAALESAEVELHQLQLEAPSWRGALAALWSDWRAATPWSGRSLNTGGFELAPRAAPSLTGFVAACAALAAAFAFALFGRAAGRRALLPIMLLALVLPALHQLAQLTGRGASASAAARLAHDRPDTPLAAQPQLAAAALRLSRGLQDAGGAPRLLVHGASQFLGEYSVWLLRAHDVAMLWEPAMLPPPGAAGDWRVVLVGAGDWEFDPARGRLRIGREERAAMADVDAGVMKSYRLSAGAAP
jgi:hypothetical protein